jgi:hypothetical protein
MHRVTRLQPCEMSVFPMLTIVGVQSYKLRLGVSLKCWMVTAGVRKKWDPWLNQSCPIGNLYKIRVHFPDLLTGY